MLLERMYDDDLAQASYLIGCQATGEALLVDPRRDTAEALALAAAHGMRITAVAETHIHADYLSGTREIAARTGAQMYVSAEGGPDWQYGAEFAGAVRLHGGDEIRIGNLTVTALHTPGHTPEHLAYLVTDGAQASEPGFLLSGDFVFVGDVGRPDLLDEVEATTDSRFAGARDLFASLRDRFLTLPDYVQVLPGHGSGSACGKALGAVPSTSVGYERRFAWWAPFLAANDEEGFVAELLSGQPDAHAYFARMKRENRLGPALLDDAALDESGELTELTSAALREELAADRAILIDTRDASLVRAGTVPGSLNIPGPAKAASYGAWALDPDRETRPLVVLAASATEATEFRAHAVRVGIDTVAGFVRSLDGLPLAPVPSVTPAELADFPHVQLLDVRGRAEYADGHIPGAVQLSAGRALWNLDGLAAGGTIVAHCRSGVRVSVIASALRREGFDVVELAGSYLGWLAHEESAQPR
ncbi:MBL fold metallo-hydrolase [Leucobacter chromiireducens]|uniref:MBL fold metallo-hydrolase n=1 Tax=Leucobacter chromiireducens TaxID=283877 RepID=UPI000F6317E3|nr:MBL fold metallo-hydrolase [Leucobacter chromiireducens]